MARYQIRRSATGFDVVNGVSGLTAMANGRRLEGLDVEDALDLLALINCVEGELLLDGEDSPVFEELADERFDDALMPDYEQVRPGHRHARDAFGYLPWRVPA